MWLRTDKSLRNVAYTNSMTQKCDLDKYYGLEMRRRPKIMTQKHVLDQFCDLEMWLRPKIKLRNVAQNRKITQKCSSDKYYDLEM